MTLVVIGSPSGVHAIQGIEAARHGLHVLTEKPIDISTRQTDQLILETEKAGVKLGVIYQDRFKSGIQFLKQLSHQANWASRFWRRHASSGIVQPGTTANRVGGELPPWTAAAR